METFFDINYTIKSCANNTVKSAIKDDNNLILNKL